MKRVRRSMGLLAQLVRSCTAAFPILALLHLTALGEVDPTFHCVLGGENGEVRAMLRQPDGKIVIGGLFTSVKGLPRYGVARLLESGAVDPDFDAGNLSGNVLCLALKPDGKLIIGGDFRSINGQPRVGIARLTVHGSLDPSFNPNATVMNSSSPGQVTALALQPDGAILIGGGFSMVNGIVRSRIARLDSAGALDTTFNPGTGLSGGNQRVNTIAVQKDGRILLGGSFARYSGNPRKNLVRIERDGSIDATFDPGELFGSEVFTVLAEPDDRIMVAGLKSCRRLLPDGRSPDPTFIEPDTGVGADGAEARTIAPLPDGGYALGGRFYRIGNRYGLTTAAFGADTWVVAGDTVAYAGDEYPNRPDLLTFTNQNTLPAPHLEALAYGQGTFIGVAANGTLLASTDLADWTPLALTVPTGLRHITFAGSTFVTVGPHGTLQQSTDRGTTWQAGTISPPGTELADLYGCAGDGTNWVAVGGTPSQAIILFSADGSTWTPVPDAGTNALFAVTHGNGLFVAVGARSTILSSPDGHTWTTHTNAFTNNLYAVAYGRDAFVAVGDSGRILAATRLDQWVNVYNYSTQTPLQPLRSITFANGKFLTVGANGTVLVSDPSVAGPSFYFLDRTLADLEMNNVALLASNGIVRRTFQSGLRDIVSVYQEIVHAILPAPSGVFVAGNFVQIALTQPDQTRFADAGDLALLKLDGTLDPAFDVGMGVGGETSANAIAVQPDGRILLGGDFTSVNGVARNRIARVLTNGTLDPDFDPGAGADRRVNVIGLQPDGRITLAGIFTGLDLKPRRPVGRLLPNGSVDPTFDPGIGLAFNDNITALAVQPDGKVILNGSTQRILRLNADGTTDRSFTNNVGLGVRGTGAINAITLLPDGNIVLGGNFTNFNGLTANRVVRLSPEGTNDLAFLQQIGTGADAAVHAIAIQYGPQSQPVGILLGGSFSNINGTARSRIAQLDSAGNLTSLLADGGGTHTNVTLLAALPATQDHPAWLYAGGAFTNFAGFPRTRLVRLDASGTVDAAFNNGSGPDASLSALAVQPDGRALIAGLFRTVDGQRQPHLARLQAGSAPSPLAQWQSAFFTATELADASISGPAADPDADGLANAVEYALNLHPRQPGLDGIPALRLHNDPANGQHYALLDYRRRLDNPAITYRVSIATNLAGQPWTTDPDTLMPFATRDDGNGVTETVTLKLRLPVQQLPTAFLQLQISLP